MIHRYLLAEERRQRRTRALVRHVQHRRLLRHQQQFHRKVIAGTHAWRGVGERAWLRARERDEFLQRLRGYRRMGDQDVRLLCQQRNRDEIVQRVVGQLPVKGFLDGHADAAEPQRVTVAFRLRDELEV